MINREPSTLSAVFLPMSRILFFLFLLGPLSLVAEPNQPIRILCIGDSITQGGFSGREEWTYRYPLVRELTEKGIAFRMLGTRTRGFHDNVTWPRIQGQPFPNYHEGYYGYRTAQVRDELRRNLPRLDPPDVALIHLGTNDQRARHPEAAIVDPLREIIVLLRERNPEVTILIGHLLFNEGPALGIRRHLDGLAEEMDTTESRVVTVPHYRNWIADPRSRRTHTFDWLHPNPAGQEKMARAWLESLRDLEVLPAAPSSGEVEPEP